MAAIPLLSIKALAVHSAALAVTPTSYHAVGAGVLPLVFAALFLDVGIVVLWYFAGVVLNNNTVKESAKGEYYQFIGTVAIAMLVLWGMTTLSSLFYSTMSGTNLLNPTAVSTMCSNLESNSPINLIGGSNSLLSGATLANGNSLVGFCQVLSGGTVTEKIDYPLAATSVVVANLTNQTATNLNSAFVIDAWLGFLSKLSPSFGFCFGLPEVAYTECLLQGGTTPAPPPTLPAGQLPAPAGTYVSGQLAEPPPITPPVSSAVSAVTKPIFEIDVKFQPYKGYSLLLSGLNTLGALLTTSLESFVAQLTLLSMFLYIWPYLLFGGLLLRSTFFTRKLGGLLIAVALGVVIIFPLMFSIEYLVLSNTQFVNPVGTALYNAQNPLNMVSAGVNTTYGFNATTPLPANSADTSANYIVNFFVEPNLEAVAVKYNCWPGVTGGSLIGSYIVSPVGGAAIQLSQSANPLATAEVTDLLYLTLGGGVVSAGVQLIGSAIYGHMTSFYMPAFCPVNGALPMFLSMLNAYGIIGVISYFIPIVNLIITMTAIIGLSGIMGGDVTLEGLSRFV